MAGMDASNPEAAMLKALTDAADAIGSMFFHARPAAPVGSTAGTVPARRAARLRASAPRPPLVMRDRYWPEGDLCARRRSRARVRRPRADLPPSRRSDRAMPLRSDSRLRTGALE